MNSKSKHRKLPGLLSKEASIEKRREAMKQRNKALSLQRKLWLTVKEAAEYLSVSPQAVYNLIHNGTFKPARIGRSVRLNREEIDLLLFNSIRNDEEAA